MQINNQGLTPFADKDDRLCIHIKKNEERYRWAMETGGSYILRTNWSETDPKTLWNTYIQLTEVEDSFRTVKHDLGMRPIFHQKPHRTHSHIPVCFLALTLWRTLQQWMKTSGLGTTPRKLLEEIKEIKSLDIPYADQRQNHQTQGGGYPLSRAQDPVTEVETSSSQ